MIAINSNILTFFQNFILSNIEYGVVQAFFSNWNDIVESDKKDMLLFSLSKKSLRYLHNYLIRNNGQKFEI